MPVSSMLYCFFFFVFYLPPASPTTIWQPSRPKNSSELGYAASCVSSRDWIDNHYVASDCQQAIRLFQSEEVLVHMDQEFEFLAPGVTPIHTLPTMATPRRYTVGASEDMMAYISAHRKISLTSFIASKLLDCDCNVQLPVIPTC